MSNLLSALNQWQQIAVQAYPDGELILSVGGDVLFDFVVVELAENEDCDSLEEAITRMNVAIKDLQKVLQALEAELEKAPPTPH